MKQKKRRMAAALIGCMLLGSLLAGCKIENVSIETAVEETTFGVLGEETFSLEEAVFYTRMLQEQWEYTYYEYYGADMWQEEVDEETGTLADALKRDVLDALTEIHLLCAHAEEYGVELSSEERSTLAERAKSFMEQNTPEVLEAAGATEERVEAFLIRNQLAAKVSDAVQESCEPEVDVEAARVGKLTYALFATTGIFDAEGNQTPFTAEELIQVKEKAEAFAARAKELGDISAAGEEVSHTLIDAYFNDETDGGAHELVAETARGLEIGSVSDLVETEEGYYIVQRISAYDEEATQENIEAQKERTKALYYGKLLESWKEKTPLKLEKALWDTVQIDGMLTEPAGM